MITVETALHVLQSYGLLLLFPLAVVEGPIVTVLAAYLATLGYFNIASVFAVVVCADLVGDSILYCLGRFGRDTIIQRWATRFALDEKYLTFLEEHFRTHGGRTLLIGKLTHAAGFIILFGAGAARMSFRSFIWFNFLGTLPKSVFFLTIGYTLGYAYTEIDSYILRASITLLVAVLVAARWWLARMQRKPA